MNYTETIEFLYNSLPQFQRIGAAAYKAGLDNTITLDNHLGNPHRKYKTIHIAGTNGKGSTSQIIYEALRAEGYSVGLYTSPHLMDFRERIIVNDAMISRDGVVDFVERNMDVIKDIKPSFFEITVALAFWWFEVQKVDYAVIEVGMGGRLDSTNIITPEVSVITNISKDHTQFLGTTLSKIATEKAGIIKDGVPVIVGDSNDEYNEVFERTAKEHGSQILFADRLEAQPYTPAMKGKYQIHNAQTAYWALRTAGISEHSIAHGIESARVAGRWQQLAENPTILCDTGHNQDGLKFVTSQLQEARGDGKLFFVFAVVNDKDLTSVLPLLPRDCYYLYSQASIPRALPVEDLANACNDAGLTGEICPTIEIAVNKAMELAGENDTIFIGGSTFTVADALPLFRVNSHLKKYLDNEILPQYKTYDKGHNTDHIEEVARGAMELASDYDVNCDMIYTAAIFHDLGLIEGRDIHHLASAKMLRNDNFISSYFTEDEINTIAEAIEDHRASSKTAPRTIYGEILSSADRIIDADKIIMRSFYHNEKHYPDCTLEENLDKIYNHIMDKYAEGGYLKLPIATKKNKAGLAHLRSLASCKSSFKAYCRELVASC